jgi:hypothetical protein
VFSNVQTDIANTTCRFNYSNSEAELTAKLDELAKANTHIRDWTQLRPERPHPWARITWLGAGSLLAVVAIWSIRRRRLFRDAEQVAAPDPARDNGSGSSWLTHASQASFGEGGSSRA